LDSDLETARALLGALSGAHDAQHDGFVEKKNLTRTKEDTQARLEEAVEAVATAGNIHYIAKDPVLAQRFLDLIPSKSGGGTTPPNRRPERAKAARQQGVRGKASGVRS
jgi:hypothetical protein